MNITRFTLDEYYKKSIYSLIYIDYHLEKYIIENSIYTKDSFLKDLRINPSSYRRARKKEQKVGFEYSNKLIKLLNISPLNIDNKQKYETLFDDVYNSFYYKTGDLKELEERINDCINDNTILNPLFYILLYIVLFQGSGNPNLMLEKYKYIYDYINYIEDDYYLPIYRDLKMLVDINYITDYQDLYKLHPIIEQSDKKGLLYYIISTKARLCKQYELSILYANESINYLVEDYNFYRLCHISVQLCSSLEALNMYEKSLDISKKAFISLSQTGLFSEDIYLMRGHYLTSLLGLKRYKEIIDFFSSEEKHNYKTYIFYLLASYKHSKGQYDTALSYLDTKDNFVESKYDYHINNIINYLNSDKKDIKSIENSTLNEGLKYLLINNFKNNR